MKSLWKFWRISALKIKGSVACVAREEGSSNKAQIEEWKETNEKEISGLKEMI